MLESSTCTNPVAQFELLVVDDDKGQLQSLQQLLHVSGYPNVTLASGGDEAMTILQNNTPQLILLDLLMPGTNGLDVIAFHHQAGLDSEIIVISGETSFPWVKEAMRLGAFDFICKPYKPEELLITIVKALDRFQEKKKILEWRNNTPKDINSHPVAVLAIGQDIIDHKKEEEEIRRFKIMTDNAVYAEAMTDLEGKLVYVNQFFAETHGYSPAELIGQNTSIFHSEDQLENVNRRTIQLRQDGYFLPCEVWHVHRHGKEFPMLMSAVVLKDDQGNPQYLATSAIDITERKQMENVIKAARNQLQATLNALPDLLFEVDSEGRIFSYHSPRSDLLAAPAEVFLNKRFADVLPQEAADACQRAISEAAQSGFSYGETSRLALPQGEHWFELSVAPLHGDDQSGQRFIMISRDITVRKQAEIALHDAEQKAQYQLSFHRIAAETAAALATATSDTEFDTAINQCLQQGQFVQPHKSSFIANFIFSLVKRPRNEYKGNSSCLGEFWH